MSAHVPGFVSIVGAGPGGLEHLTLRAARCLAEADLVLYDALVAPDVLAVAARADHVFVGKRAARVHTAQAAIHAAMIDAARAGRRVVRLKGGDPFVFGRGSEEALALQAAGVAYEIVPGVSSATAAAALAGVPLTHRGVSAGVVVLTGAERETCDRTIDALPPGLVTLVLLMSLASRREIGERLLARGWRRDTPAAVILGAASERAWVWKAALADLPDMHIPAAVADLPGTIVVGDVVALPLLPATRPAPIAAGSLRWATAATPPGAAWRECDEHA